MKTPLWVLARVVGFTTVWGLLLFLVLPTSGWRIALAAAGGGLIGNVVTNVLLFPKDRPPLQDTDSLDQ